MAKCGYVRLCMVIYGYVGLCFAKYGYVWLFIVCVWLCMAL